MSRSMNGRRGFTLIEVMVSVAVVGIAAAGTSAMMVTIARRNAAMAAQAEAVSLATRLVAEIQDAQLFPGNSDPGLLQGGVPASDVFGGEIGAPVPGSSIVTVGRFRPGAAAPSADGDETFDVRYEVRACGICAAPFGAGTPSLGGVDVLVSVYELGFGNRLLRPVRMTVRKELMPAQGAAAPRGW
ncbi:MAG: prepilin-type N-terminal cleavage/methylation domain-containing protein [Deltaproteobacteria bacterium]|jgi:prepilin-type N-terminal cleavage/methylation domain-containing protein|nr:prepilin-type N-terminal cleavage/methylation domain-containing protein [Deltaproteobacteria bacterium]